MLKNNPVGWFEIYVQDMKRARKFYETVFACKLEDLPLPGSPELEMCSFPMDAETRGSAGALIRMDGFEPGGNSVIVYFTSEDCSIEEKRIVAAGGEIQKSKTSIGPYGFVTLAFDSERNIFGIHSRQ